MDAWTAPRRISAQRRRNRAVSAVGRAPAVLVAAGLLAVTAGAVPPASASQSVPSASASSSSAGAKRSPALEFTASARQRKLSFPKEKPKIGTMRTWPAFDFSQSVPYPKDFTLRLMGEHVEMWVATPSDGVSTGLDFPLGDCRNGPATMVTDEQLRYLAAEFDENILPIESAVFSVAPERDGRNATLPTMVPNVPSSAYKGEGDNLIVLVDQIRGPGFYDRDNARSLGQPWGFVHAGFIELTDRNIVTISGYGWRHRLGSAPVDAPAPGDPCRDFPAYTNAMEAVFAHEYHHLLEGYQDPEEMAWVSEGISTWAEMRTGYIDFRQGLMEPRHSPQVQCFLGNGHALPLTSDFHCPSGPANSLTQWGDQGTFADGGIWGDYGAAGTFMAFLSGRYGDEIIGALHRDRADGLASLRAALQSFHTTQSVDDVIRDWAATVAMDGVLDDGAVLAGAAAERISSRALRSTVNWDVDAAYAAPGVTPNGSDYVRLRNGAGAYLKASDISSISFAGASGASLPVEWSIDPIGDEDGGAGWHSGDGARLDRSIVHEVTVPTENPVLTFQTRYITEQGWDFGFVQISTDRGKTYASLPGITTTTTAEPGAPSAVLQHLPGFTGDSGGWVREHMDLSEYAGKTVHLAFRYLTDSSVNLPGWWVDDVAVGNVTLSDGSTLVGWQTQTELQPVAVSGWSVQLIAYTQDHRAAWIAAVPLDAAFRGSLSGTTLTASIGETAETVAAIVTMTDQTEALPMSPHYSLSVNGAVQPGG